MFYHALTGNGGTGDLEPVLLWENDSPTTNFSGQKIALDLTEYAGIIVEFADNTSNSVLCTRLFAKKTDTYGGKFGAGYGVGGDAWARKIDALDDTGITIHSATAGDQYVIPTKIYGVKEYVVEPQIGDLLWTNPSPSTAFASQTINIDTSGYEYIKVNTSNESVIVNDRGALLSTDGTAIKSAVKSDNNIIIGNTIIISTSAQDNTKLIPISIIGIKAIS